MLVLPAGLKLLGYAAAALAEPGVAKVPLKCQRLAEGLLDGGLSGCTDNAGAALITLAVVIGTYIKEGVLVVIIPLYYAVQYIVMFGCDCRGRIHVIR